MTCSNFSLILTAIGFLLVNLFDWFIKGCQVKIIFIL